MPAIYYIKAFIRRMESKSEITNLAAEEITLSLDNSPLAFSSSLSKSICSTCWFAIILPFPDDFGSPALPADSTVGTPPLQSTIVQFTWTLPTPMSAIFANAPLLRSKSPELQPGHLSSIVTSTCPLGPCTIAQVLHCVNSKQL
eukprot:NODE_277_length_11973_cov_0.221895.p8 type:complete len:144 gc:universal NODE_277_length_11973_cov_0.221895:2106-2537(+)